MLKVTVTSPAKGVEGVFNTKSSLIIEGKDCGSGQVLVKDKGEGKAELTLVEDRPSKLNGVTIKSFKGNIEASYEGEALAKGTELEFSKFSFTHKED